MAIDFSGTHLQSVANALAEWRWRQTDISKPKSADRDTRIDEMHKAWKSGWLDCIEFMGRTDPGTAAKLHQRLYKHLPQLRSVLNDRDNAGKTRGEFGHTQPRLLHQEILLHQIANRIRHSLDESQVCQAIAQQLCRVLEGDCAGLILYDLEKQILSVAGSYYQNQSCSEQQATLVQGMTLRLGTPDDRNARWNFPRSPWIISDLSEAEMPEQELSVLQAFGVNSALMVPIEFQNQLLGLAYIAHNRSCRLWTSEEINLAELVAQEAAIAITHSRLYSSQVRRSRREQVLHRLQERIRTSLDIRTTIDSALEDLLPLIGADTIFFSVPLEYDSKTLRISHQAMKVSARKGDAENVFHSALNIGSEIKLENFGTYLQQLIDPGITAIANTQTPDISQQARTYFLEHQIRALLHYPIIYQERLLGYVSAIATQPLEWSADEISSLKAVGSGLAIAIAHQQFYTQIQQQADLAASQAERLQQSDLFLRTLIDSTPDWIFVKDRQLRYVLVNQGLAKTMGRHPEDFLGLTDYDFFPSYLVDGCTELNIRGKRQDDLEVIETGKVVRNEKDWTEDPNGNLLCLNMLKMPLRDESGNIIGAIGIGRDETERDRLQQEREQLYAETHRRAEREALLNQLVASLHSNLDLGHLTEQICEGLAEALDVDRVSVWLFNEDFTRLQCQYGTSQHQDVPAIESLAVADLPLYFEAISSHQPLVASAVASDYRLKELWQDDLEHLYLQSRLDLPIIHSLQDRGNKTVPNSQSSQGLSALSGVLSLEHYSPRYWQPEEVALVKAVSDQLAIAIGQAQLYNRTQQQAREAQAQAERLTRILEELYKTQSQLIQSEKMSSLGQMVAGVAHEINNPINFIYGNIPHITNYTQDILELIDLYKSYLPEPPAEIAEFEEKIDLEFLRSDFLKILSSMGTGAERVREIVLTLRNFSRIEEAEVKVVDLHEGIDSTLILLNHRLKRDIETIRDYGDLPKVECYPGQLNQVFMNILSNAIDAVESAREQNGRDNQMRITIRTELSKHSSVIVRIADTGIGITEEVRRKLFDPFFTTKPVGKGTGLGLSISYKIIVDKHKGLLGCVSEVGKGTEFWIEIPIAQQKSQNFTSSADSNQLSCQESN